MACNFGMVQPGFQFDGTASKAHPRNGLRPDLGGQPSCGSLGGSQCSDERQHFSAMSQETEIPSRLYPRLAC